MMTIGNVSKKGLAVKTLFSTRHLGNEMIDFQTADTFGPQAEKVVEGIYEGIRKRTFEYDKDSQTKVLTALIFKRFGIKVHIYTQQNLAAVLPFYANRNHIFLNDIFRGNVDIKDQTAFLKNMKTREGTVDRKAARVGGFFSEYVHDLYMNFNTLSQMGLTVAEAVAVLLHEIGHIFSACEYANRMDTTNQVLADVAKKFSTDKDIKHRTYIYTELKKVNNKITEEEAERLVSSTDIIAGYTWFKVVAQTVTTQMTDVKYDETSFQALADNFANRMGYGRAGVTALDKLHSVIGSPEKSKSMRIFMHALDIAITSLIVIAIGASAMTGAIGIAVIYSVFLALSFVVAGEKFADYTYDDLKTRYQRERNTLVEYLKNPNLDKKVVKETLEAIEQVDDIIKKTEPFKSIFNMLSNLILPWNWSTVKSVDEQKFLENLAANELFVKAAAFKSI